MASIASLVIAMATQAQTMNVVAGQVTYQFPAEQTGEMTYSEGKTLTVMGKVFNLSDITKIYIDDTAVTANSVQVAYDGSQAMVLVAGNIAQYIEPTVSGAHVGIVQGDVADEVTYVLSGQSDDGEFYMSGSYKATLELDGLTLTNQTPVYSGAAIYVQNGKRIDVSVKKGTVSTLTDCPSGSQKGCLWIKGHAEFKGKGTLNVYGKVKHAIKTGEYMTLKNCTVNVLEAVGDGVNVSEYFLMESGELTVSGVGDDGIQADIDGTASTGATADHEDEDSGNVYLEGGTLTVTVTAAASKGVKAAGDLFVNDGIIAVTTTGNGTYDSDEQDAKGCAALKSDGNMTISGGTLTLKSTGSGGKCIKADGLLTVSGGTTTATSTGSQYRYNSSYTASAKAVKAGAVTTSGSGRNVTYKYSGGIVVTGGTLTASSSSHEAIESKSTIDISGGTVYAYSSDDAINSASDFTVTDGYVMGYSTGNDGMDANGDFYIKGGTVYAISTRSPEVAIDANTEGGHQLYVTGGNIVAIGGLENGSSLSQTCYQASSYSTNTWYGLYSGSTLLLAFKVPSGSSMGTPMVVSTAGTPALKSGVSVSGGTSIWNGYGSLDATVSGGSSVSLSGYTGGNGGPGGGGPGGGGGHGGGGWW